MGLLRFYLAVVVLISHMAHIVRIDTLISGPLAVRLFFVISGFYIQTTLINYQGQDNWKRKFYLSRVLRIYPGYFLILVLTAIYYGSTCNSFCTNMVINEKVSSLLFYYFSNIFIIGQSVSKFMTYHYSTGAFSFDPLISNPDYWLNNMFLLKQGWSVAMELELYLLAPFLLRLSTPKLIAIALTAVFAKNIVFSIGYNNADNWYNSFLPFSLHSFLLGAIAARLAAERVIYEKYFALFISGGVLFAGLWFFKLNTLIPDGDVLALWGLFCIIPIIFRYSNNSRLDKWIGDLSYPIYLNHLLIIAVLGNSFDLLPHTYVLLAIISSCAMAVAMVYCIDRPLESFRHRRLRNNATSLAREEGATSYIYPTPYRVPA